MKSKNKIKKLLSLIIVAMVIGPMAATSQGTDLFSLNFYSNFEPFAGPDGANIIPFLPIGLSLLTLILLLLITKRVLQDDLDISDYPITSSISKFLFPKSSK